MFLLELKHPHYSLIFEMATKYGNLADIVKLI